MTKTEALKELLRNNIKNLNSDAYFDLLSIEFKDDKFIVLDNSKKVILKDSLNKYGLDYDSQKKFVLKVASKLTFFVKILEDLDEEYFENLIKIDGKNYINVTSNGNIYKTSKYVDLNLNKLYKKYEKNKDCGESWNDFVNDMLDYYIKEIKRFFEDTGVRIVLYRNYNPEKAGFYVDAEIYEDWICITYIDNLEGLETSSDIDEIVNCKGVTLYYSFKKDKKEANRAVNFIKELVV